MILYSIKKVKDKYIITNDGALSINYTTKKLFDCVNFLQIYDGEILAGESYEVDLMKDGEYQIILSQDEETNITIPIKYYLELQLSFIENVLNVVCECGCGCKDCIETSKNKYCNLLTAKAKIDIYKRFINPEAVSYFDSIYEYTKCLVEKPIYCTVAKELILGKSSCNEKLIKQLISLDYLALYFYEFDEACINGCKDYVRTKFKTEKIFCCIQSLGIDIGNIEQLIN